MRSADNLVRNRAREHALVGSSRGSDGHRALDLAKRRRASQAVQTASGENGRRVRLAEFMQFCSDAGLKQVTSSVVLRSAGGTVTDKAALELTTRLGAPLAASWDHKEALRALKRGHLPSFTGV